jgi:hypothetical protein
MKFYFVTEKQMIFPLFLCAWKWSHTSNKLPSTGETVSPPKQSVLTAVEPSALDHFYQ